MRAMAFGLLIFAVLAATTAATVAADLPSQRDPAKRSQQRAAASSTVALPGLRRAFLALAPVTPEDSERAIRARPLPENLNPHLAPPARIGQKAQATTLPPSIVELARALRNDADLIYEFVRNNIDYYPVWGTQKGALGALLDNQGTAFDQAALMVALLRQGTRHSNTTYLAA